MKPHAMQLLLCSSIRKLPKEQRAVIAAGAHNRLLRVEHHLIHAAFVAWQGILHLTRACRNKETGSSTYVAE
jgi:hypothetical protein